MKDDASTDQTKTSDSNQVSTDEGVVLKDSTLDKEPKQKSGFMNNSWTVAGAIFVGFMFLGSDEPGEPEIAAAESSEMDPRLKKCINMAMESGYGDEHCAHSYLNACTTGTTKSEIMEAYRWDFGPLGYGSHTMCGPEGNPNGQQYTKAWRQVFNENDKLNW